MFTKKILLNFFLTTIIGATVTLTAASSGHNNPSSSSSTSMFSQIAENSYPSHLSPYASQLHPSASSSFHSAIPGASSSSTDRMFAMAQGQSANHGYPISHPGFMPQGISCMPLVHCIPLVYSPTDTIFYSAAPGASSSNARGMLTAITDGQSVNYQGYSTFHPPYIPQLHPNTDVSLHLAVGASSSSTVTENQSANSGERSSLPPRLPGGRCFSFEDGSVVEIRSLNTMAGEEIAVELSSDKHNFILQHGKKMGMISVDKISRIAGNPDQSYEITPLGDLLSEQLFGQIAGTNDEKDFGFIGSESTIKRLRKLMYKKFKKVFIDMCKTFDHKELSNDKIWKDMLNDHDFVEKLVNLSSEISNLYGGNLPCDIKYYIKFRKMISDLREYSHDHIARETIEGPMQIIRNSHRSINFNGKKLRFRHDYEIPFVDKSNDRIKFKIVMPRKLDRNIEFYFDIDAYYFSNLCHFSNVSNFYISQTDPYNHFFIPQGCPSNKPAMYYGKWLNDERSIELVISRFCLNSLERQISQLAYFVNPSSWISLDNLLNIYLYYLNSEEASMDVIRQAASFAPEQQEAEVNAFIESIDKQEPNFARIESAGLYLDPANRQKYGLYRNIKSKLGEIIRLLHMHKESSRVVSLGDSSRAWNRLMDNESLS